MKFILPLSRYIVNAVANLHVVALRSTVAQARAQAEAAQGVVEKASQDVTFAQYAVKEARSRLIDRKVEYNQAANAAKLAEYAARVEASNLGKSL